MDPKLTQRKSETPNDSATRQPNSFDHLRWIRGLPITRSQKLMMFVLESYAQLRDGELEPGECYPSQKTLAAACGCTTRLVMQDLRALEQAGCIERVRKAPAATGDGRRNLYRIKYPKPASDKNTKPASRRYAKPASVEQDRETSQKTNPGKSLSKSSSSSKVSARTRARPKTRKGYVEEWHRKRAEAGPSRSPSPKDGDEFRIPTPDHQPSRNTKPASHIPDGVPESAVEATPMQLQRSASYQHLDEWGFRFFQGALTAWPDWYRGMDALTAVRARVEARQPRLTPTPARPGPWLQRTEQEALSHA
jgi:hypothetical protein